MMLVYISNDLSPIYLSIYASCMWAPNWAKVTGANPPPTLATQHHTTNKPATPPDWLLPWQRTDQVIPPFFYWLLMHAFLMM